MKKTVIMIIFSFLFTSNLHAHPGRLDAQGGHFNRRTDEYHHHGKYIPKQPAVKTLPLPEPTPDNPAGPTIFYKLYIWKDAAGIINITDQQPRKDTPLVVKTSAIQKNRHSDEPLAYQLATINAGKRVPQNHITVARFRSLLNQLSSTFVEDKQQIADMSVTAKQLLEKDGIDEELLSIMEGMNELFTQRIKNQRYAEYISAYVTLRAKGQSHVRAINGLQAILRKILEN